MEKMENKRKNASIEAELIAKKKAEKAKEQLQLQKDEAHTRKLVDKMVSETDTSLSPVTSLLSHFEGIIFFI